MDNYHCLEDVYESSHPSLAALHTEATKIQAVIELPVDLDNPGDLTERLKVLDVYLARLGDMKVRAKALKEREKNLYLEEHEAEFAKMTATASNRKISAFLHDFTVAADRLETMYDTVSKISKSIVTQISFIKQQMQMR